MRLARLKCCHVFYYRCLRMVILKDDFDRDSFNSSIEKKNDYYKGCYIKLVN